MTSVLTMIALLINFYDDDIEKHLAELDRDAPYLIHCAQGVPGFRGWLAADRPFVTGA